MIIRTFFLCLIAACFTARASEPISAPDGGKSETVSQPHVTAELIPEMTTVKPGQPFDVALHLHMDPGWHTYWINPGDAGLATTIKWTLPPGFTAGPIQWPTPEKHNMGPLITYGYEGDVYLLTTITPPKSDLPQHFDIKANAQWLVCQEECIPGHADLTLTLDSGLLNLRLPIENKDFFDQARERLPVPNTLWDVKGAYGTLPELGGMAAEALEIMFTNKAGIPKRSWGSLHFFPEQPNVLDSHGEKFLPDPTQKSSDFNLWITLQQNGEKPDVLSGVLISDQPLIGKSHAVYISAFSIKNAPNEVPTISAATPTKAPSGGPDNSLSGLSRASGATGGSPQLSAAEAKSSLTNAPSGLSREELNLINAPADMSSASAAQPLLLAVLGAAFIGGLILNLMPCVLPVLSLKVFSLMKHAGNDPHGAWKQGAAFTVGVVVSFWVLAGLLLALRAAGNQLGWGFQMQSPGFVLALILLFFLLALNLFGVFEFGTSLVGLDAKAAGRSQGLTSSFLNGALATLAATPCTAPFMGSSLGFAAQQPPFIALLIFTFLAFGMATPYLLLTIFPGALRFVPKPGAWMEAFKQFMGFLLMASVIWLISVFGALTGQDQVPWLLIVLLLAGLAAWIYGRWANPLHSGSVRLVAFILTLGLLGYAIHWGIMLAQATPPKMSDTSSTVNSLAWQPWSPAAVDQALAQGRPVFVDFTAAWCLSCKVNERVALVNDAVEKAFAAKNVALFKADWTHADPEISKALRQYNRDGVPLYLLYSPKNKNPQVLPEVLTPGIVLEALKNL